MSYKEIILEFKGRVAVLTLNRPEQRNPIGRRIAEHEMPAAIEEIRLNDDIRSVILTGAGKGFCAGGDVKMLGSIISGVEDEHVTRHAMVQPVGFMAHNLQSLNKPIIAAVNGVAVGAGMGLAALCDFRIAVPRAKFGSVFVLRGLTPDSGLTWSLSRIVGLPQALRLMLLGEIIDAAEAQRIGFVDQIVEPEELMSTCMAFAERLAEMPPIAVELTKQAAYQGLNNDLYSQLMVESRGMNLCLKTEDFMEGVSAFLERRPPQYKGK